MAAKHSLAETAAKLESNAGDFAILRLGHRRLLGRCGQRFGDGGGVPAVGRQVFHGGGRGEGALACIGVSPSYPAREMRDAVALAEEIGVPYRLVETEEYLDPNYAANPNNRCYFCKSDLHNRLHEILQQEDWGIVCDGTNASDMGD